MGINEIRALKAGKTGTVMTVAEVKKQFPSVKFGTNKMEGKFHSGSYETAKGLMYFRSKWEANYALYLDWLVKQKQIKDWKYEDETFFFDKIKLGTRSYRTDFTIIHNDGLKIYHEVKGYMDAKSKTKLKRMKKYFPLVPIIVIGRKEYDAILKSMKGLIKFY